MRITATCSHPLVLFHSHPLIPPLSLTTSSDPQCLGCYMDMGPPSPASNPTPSSRLCMARTSMPIGQTLGTTSSTRTSLCILYPCRHALRECVTPFHSMSLCKSSLAQLGFATLISIDLIWDVSSLHRLNNNNCLNVALSILSNIWDSRNACVFYGKTHDAKGLPLGTQSC